MPTARDMGVDRMGNDKRADLPDRFSARRRAASQAQADKHPAAANENRPEPAPGTTADPGPPGSPRGVAGRRVRPCAWCPVPGQARHGYAFPRLRTLAGLRPEPGPACERAHSLLRLGP